MQKKSNVVPYDLFSKHAAKEPRGAISLGETQAAFHGDPVTEALLMSILDKAGEGSRLHARADRDGRSVYIEAGAGRSRGAVGRRIGALPHPTNRRKKGKDTKWSFRFVMDLDCHPQLADRLGPTMFGLTECEVSKTIVDGEVFGLVFRLPFKKNRERYVKRNYKKRRVVRSATRKAARAKKDQLASKAKRDPLLRALWAAQRALRAAQRKVGEARKVRDKIAEAIRLRDNDG